MALAEPRATALDRLIARGVEPERILGPEELRWLRGAFERAAGDAGTLSADDFHEALLENLPTHDTLPEGHAELLLEVRELRGDQTMSSDQLVIASAQRRVAALEPPRGALEAQPAVQPMWRLAHEAAEDPVEVVDGEVGERGQILRLEFLVEVLVDVVHHPQDALAPGVALGHGHSLGRRVVPRLTVPARGWVRRGSRNAETGVKASRAPRR